MHIPERPTRQQFNTTPPLTEAGYSLPLILVVAVVLIAGASALVNRNGSMVFGAVFQKQSWEARGLAELGMATLVSRLNREENRYLLAAPSSAITSSSYRNSIWSTNSATLAANHSNPCADTYVTSPTTGLQVKQSVPPQIHHIYPASNPNGWWYVNSSGQVSTSSTNAIGKFRLLSNAPLSPGSNFRMGSRWDNSANPTEELNFTKATGKSLIKLSVEAVSLNANGTDKARAVLEEVLDVVPKCCRTTFGNDHGNNNYRAAYDANNPFGTGSCLPPIDSDSFGIVYGISGNGGLLKTTGNATEVWRREDNGSITPINPVACIQLSSSNPCRVDGTFNGISGSNTAELLEVLNTRMPQAPEWYPGKASATAMPTFLPLAATSSSAWSVCRSADLSNTTSPDCRNLNGLPAKLNDTSGINRNPATTPFFRYCLDSQCTRTYINGNASAANLPPHCKRAALPPNGDGALHCVASKLELGNGSNKLQFVTGVTASGAANPTVKPIRIYFPVASSSGGNQTDYIISQSGSTWIEHCVEATPDPTANAASAIQCKGSNTTYKERVTQLSMFGCNMGSNYYGVPCGPQFIALQGSASSLGYFSYFPTGNIELQGNADIEGVLWSNNLNSTGSGDFIVPASGINDVFELIGINPGINNNCDGSIYGFCPEAWQPKWDFVARSVRRFSFKFG